MSQRIQAPCGCYIVACGPVEIINIPLRQDTQVRGRPSVRPTFGSRPKATAVQGYDPQAATSAPHIESWKDPKSCFYMPNAQRDSESRAHIEALTRQLDWVKQQNSPGPDGNLPSPTKVGSSAYPPHETSRKRRPAQLKLASEDEHTSGAEGTTQNRRSPTSPRQRRSPGAERTSPTASNSQPQRFQSPLSDEAPSEPAEQSEGEYQVVQSRHQRKRHGKQGQGKGKAKDHKEWLILLWSDIEAFMPNPFNADYCRSLDVAICL